MPRKKHNYIVVVIKGGKIASQDFGEDLEGASDLLLEYEDGQALLGDGAVVPFKVKREPTIVIGATAAPVAKKRAPRTRKPKAANGTRFSADGSRVVDTDPESPPAPAPEQHPDVEA